MQWIFFVIKLDLASVMCVKKVNAKVGQCVASFRFIFVSTHRVKVFGMNTNREFFYYSYSYFGIISKKVIFAKTAAKFRVLKIF